MELTLGLAPKPRHQAPSPTPHVLLPTLEEAMPVLTSRVNWSGGKPREGLNVVCSPRRTVEGSHMVSIQMVIKCCQFYLHPKHLSRRPAGQSHCPSPGLGFSPWLSQPPSHPRAWPLHSTLSQPPSIQLPQMERILEAQRG